MGADNQQETPMYIGGSSETTRETLSKEICKAYLQGALHDGTFNEHNQRYRFSQTGTDWLKVLKFCLLVTGSNSWIYKEGKNRKVFVLETLADFLDVNFDPSGLVLEAEKKAYIRGFFDAEGGIPKNPNSLFYIQLVQNDKRKLEQIKFILDEFGVRTGKVHNPSLK